MSNGGCRESNSGPLPHSRILCRDLPKCSSISLSLCPVACDIVKVVGAIFVLRVYAALRLRVGPPTRDGRRSRETRRCVGASAASRTCILLHASLHDSGFRVVAPTSIADIHRHPSSPHSSSLDDDVYATRNTKSTTFIAAKTSAYQYPVSAPSPSIGDALAKSPSSGLDPSGTDQKNDDDDDDDDGRGDDDARRRASRRGLVQVVRGGAASARTVVHVVVIV
jgi:hypothetical protein